MCAARRTLAAIASKHEADAWRKKFVAGRVYKCHWDPDKPDDCAVSAPHARGVSSTMQGPRRDGSRVRACARARVRACARARVRAFARSRVRATGKLVVATRPESLLLRGRYESAARGRYESAARGRYVCCACARCGWSCWWWSHARQQQSSRAPALPRLIPFVTYRSIPFHTTTSPLTPHARALAPASCVSLVSSSIVVVPRDCRFDDMT